MKKIIALILLVLVLCATVFSLSSCGKIEDVKGIKVTSITLEFNFYEVATYQKNDLKDKINSDSRFTGLEDNLSGILEANKDGDQVIIAFCKSEELAKDAVSALSPLADELGENYSIEQFEKIVFIGTSKGLTSATQKLWINRLYHTFVEDNNYMYIVKGFGNTIIITLGALFIGVILGVLVAVAKYYAEGNKKLRIINFICDLYTTVIRGIPITVLLLIFFFIIMVKANGILVAIIAFGINSGAYMAELVRGGINAVDNGQMEAARSLGLSKWQSMKTIIFPQAIKNILPAIGNECIALLKETSVAGYVAVVDLTRGANLIRNITYDAFNPLILSAIIYLTLVIIMTKLLSILERRLRKSDGK